MAEEEKVIRAFLVLGIQPVAMSMVTSTVLAPGSSTTWITPDGRLGARLTPGPCRELAALLDLAIAGSDIGVPGQPSR